MEEEKWEHQKYLECQWTKRIHSCSCMEDIILHISQSANSVKKKLWAVFTLDIYDGVTPFTGALNCDCWLVHFPTHGLGPLKLLTSFIIFVSKHELMQTSLRMCDTLSSHIRSCNSSLIIVTFHYKPEPLFDACQLPHIAQGAWSILICNVNHACTPSVVCPNFCRMNSAIHGGEDCRNLRKKPRSICPCKFYDGVFCNRFCSHKLPRTSWKLRWHFVLPCYQSLKPQKKQEAQLEYTSLQQSNPILQTLQGIHIWKIDYLFNVIQDISFLNFVPLLVCNMEHCIQKIRHVRLKISHQKGKIMQETQETDVSSKQESWMIRIYWVSQL